MNAIVDILNKTEKLVRENSSSILTALGVSGTIGTAYLAGKASFKAAHILAEEERITTQRVETRDAIRYVWKLYIPTAVSGTMTVVCIIGAAKITSRRTAAITAAYSLSEKAFTEYKEKVIETLGEKKEQKVRDEIAAAQIRDSPPQNSTVVLAGTGDVLCCEMWTGRYFSSDMETLRRSVNTINAKLISQNEATLSDFYYLIGVPQTSSSSYSGWTSDKMLELSFTSLLHEGKPVLAFDYNYVKPV
jgi:hypothetical protein